MKIQIVPKINKEKETELFEALVFIREKKQNGEFTVKAKKFQEEFHSSISILKKLRQTKLIKHIDD